MPAYAVADETAQQGSQGLYDTPLVNNDGGGGGGGPSSGSVDPIYQTKDEQEQQRNTSEPEALYAVAPGAGSNTGEVAMPVIARSPSEKVSVNTNKKFEDNYEMM